MRRILLGFVTAVCILLMAMPIFAAQKDKMRVVLTNFSIILDAMVAQEKGYFNMLGLDFEPVSVKGGTATIISSISSGEVDGCFLASSGAFSAWSKGVKLVQVAGNGNMTFDFVARKDSPIQSLKDFEGKKIANKPRPSGPWLSLRYDLDKYKINAQVIDVQTEDLALSALLSEQVDVAISESHFMPMYGDKIKLVHTSTISKYLFNSCGWWFKVDYIKEHPIAVKRFVDGLLLGRQFIKEHPQESIQILAKGTHLNVAEFKFPETFVLPTFDMPTTIYKYGLDQMYEIFKNYNLIEGDVNVSDLVCDTYSIVIDQDY
jgi:ABC-type nitrate/sulfonate/bicarbonate transport system substrate-binding protein